MMYVIQSSDGTTEYDEVMQNALARTLMEMTQETRHLVITQMDISADKVERNMEDGTIRISEDPSTFKHNSLVHQLTQEQVKAVLSLGFLAESALTVRDGLLTDLFGSLLVPGTNDLNFDAYPDTSGMDS